MGGDALRGGLKGWGVWNGPGEQASEVPVEFPDGTTPVVARAEIHHSQGAPCSLQAVLASPPPPLAAGDCFFQHIRVRLGMDLLFCTSGHELEFGCCPQDAWAQLGAPGDLTYKKVDTMVIHAGQPHGASEFRQDYFYNYYHLGMDILFDGATHRAKKFVLHTNHVGHADFNSYVKCNFVIEKPDSGGAGHDGEGSRSDTVTADSTWEEVQRCYGQSGRPAVHMTGAASNPFGPTYFFGYPNVTFEIMRNGHIASVTLFSTAGEGKDASSQPM
ncbi:hypothetical protein CYMTET_7295 [Cymbomonas tetramitiformis]|uniref:Uncharacterized protein n=1 Tax=Cymbomonas tetramitiformis TaxID=36881 RepID=A0AAE0GVR8_9CHLO|nr:hypothetical protein CYMTET_7295 [Cymbomonas tetramitiformis]